MRAKSGAVNIARRRRRAVKNAAKVARMERRIQNSAASPFSELHAGPAGSETETGSADITPIERFRGLAQASSDKQTNDMPMKTTSSSTAEKSVNLSLVETPFAAVDAFTGAIGTSNTFLTPCFGIDNSLTAIVAKHILTTIQAKHATQEGANVRLERGEDVTSHDSGFTNTSVLVLLPSRNMALRFVRSLTQAFDAIEKLEQFEKDFGPQEEEDKKFTRRPLDHRALFEGNVDDKFCIGVQIERETVLLYSEYRHSDILVASPLGLAHYLGIDDDAEGGTGRSAAQPDRSFLLASIEVLFIPMLEVFLMQNWGRLKSVVERVNAPVELRDTSDLGDFTRLKPQFRESTARFHRQNIFTSLFQHPYFHALFRQVSKGTQLPNAELIDEGASGPAALDVLRCRVRQYFLRVPVADGLAASHAERLRYFTEKLYPTRLSYYFASRAPILVIVPSYYQYVAVRAFFEENMSESYSDVCEYTSDTDRRRALRNFNARQVHVLLTTERYYFYRRHFIKGAVLLVWYAPPVFPQFYVEIVEAIDTQNASASVLTLFSKYDAHALTRVVGGERARMFLQSGVESDVFCVH